MRDVHYFGLLTLSIICAVATPFLIRALLTPMGNKPRQATLASLCVVVGFAATLPFLRTSEAPWLPLVAAGYYGVVILRTIFLRLSVPRA